MRPESILPGILDRVANLNGVCEDEKRVLYARAEESMRLVEKMRSEIVDLRDQVARLRGAASEFMDAACDWLSEVRTWDSYQDLRATLSDTAPEEAKER